MGKSQLDKLKEDNDFLHHQISELENKVNNLESEIYELEDEIEELEDGFLDTSGLNDLMKYERLAEHWDNITLDDIEAIIR